MNVLILSDEGVEDIELQYPYYRLLEEGHDVTLASGEMTFKGKHGTAFKADITYDKINPNEYDMVVLPGGKGPEKVRLNEDALTAVRHLDENNKKIAAICHGPQILVSAGIIENRNVTGWKGIRDDLKAAGAKVDDKEVVVDENLITSRMPDDLPAFMREVLA